VVVFFSVLDRASPSSIIDNDLHSTDSWETTTHCEAGSFIKMTKDPHGKIPKLEAGKNLFHVDHVFLQKIENRIIYDTAVRNVVKKVTNGQNGTVIVYGLPDMGNTTVMLGPNNLGSFGKPDNLVGIAAQQICQLLNDGFVHEI
jgi:hypothetical protein